MEPTEAITLAIAAPISVPATPNVDETTAAETAARALAKTWVRLGRTCTGALGRSVPAPSVGEEGVGGDDDEAISGAGILLSLPRRDGSAGSLAARS